MRFFVPYRARTFFSSFLSPPNNYAYESYQMHRKKIKKCQIWSGKWILMCFLKNDAFIKWLYPILRCLNKIKFSTLFYKWLPAQIYTRLVTYPI